MDRKQSFVIELDADGRGSSGRDKADSFFPGKANPEELLIPGPISGQFRDQRGPGSVSLLRPPQTAPGQQEKGKERIQGQGWHRSQSQLTQPTLTALSSQLCQLLTPNGNCRQWSSLLDSNSLFSVTPPVTQPPTVCLLPSSATTWTSSILHSPTLHFTSPSSTTNNDHSPSPGPSSHSPSIPRSIEAPVSPPDGRSSSPPSLPHFLSLLSPPLFLLSFFFSSFPFFLSIPLLYPSPIFRIHIPRPPHIHPPFLSCPQNNTKNFSYTRSLDPSASPHIA